MNRIQIAKAFIVFILTIVTMRVVNFVGNAFVDKATGTYMVVAHDRVNMIDAVEYKIAAKYSGNPDPNVTGLFRSNNQEKTSDFMVFWVEDTYPTPKVKVMGFGGEVIHVYLCPFKMACDKSVTGVDALSYLDQESNLGFVVKDFLDNQIMRDPRLSMPNTNAK